MPNRRLEAGAVAAFFLLGWRRAIAEPAALTGRLLLYLLILAIFRQLWLATPLQELGPDAPTAADMLWYVTVTEWIVFAAGLPYRVVEDQIRSGQIESALLRPLPYAAATLAEWSGATAFYLLVMGGAGTAAAAWLTGTAPPTAAAAPLIVASGVVGCAIALLCQLQLGYAAAWLGTSAPLFWIWQKLLFVCGGLLLPLTLYPPALRGLAEYGPFAAILFAPGSLILAPAGTSVAGILGRQVAWFAAIALLTVAVDRAATARLSRRGV
ncbi:MAG TPA: ABC-2 family transporter protein [Candidatus Acidoferrum sp.]|nr:ABC-2 family transporter protein [Candidatus Acidoferrum sp.]